MADYGLVENYLHRFCGINPGSAHTYMKIFRDASHKSLDVTAVLDLPQTMTDVRVLFRRCGVRYDDAWYSPPSGLHEKGSQYLILAQDPQDPKCITTVGVVWAHVVQVNATFIESNLLEISFHVI